MGMRDTRVKKSTEVLNGMKVIKLFSWEIIQEQRLKNSRDQEIALLFKFGLIMTVFSVIATCLAPLMTSIAFLAMILKGKFNLGTAFTTLY